MDDLFDFACRSLGVWPVSIRGASQSPKAVSARRVLRCLLIEHAGTSRAAAERALNRRRIYHWAGATAAERILAGDLWREWADGGETWRAWTVGQLGRVEILRCS